MLSQSPSFFVSLLILFISSSHTAANAQDLQQLGGQHQHAKRMNLPSMMAGGNMGSSQSQHHGPPKDPPEPLSTNCTISALVPQTWKSLRLDGYLKNYPNGNTTSLPPCYPAALPDWYILFAVEQWNIQINSMKRAIQWSANYVRCEQTSFFLNIASLFSFPAINTEGIDNFKIDFIENGACMMVSNTMLLDIFSFCYQFQDRANDVMNIINNVMAAAFELGGGLLNAPKPPEGNREAFNEWTHLENQMVKYEKTRFINSGISTDQGIYGQLKNGTFLQPNEAIYLPLVTDDLKNVTTAVSLVQILRSVDAFVTVGSDILKNQKYEPKFANAWVISDHFGYSTQFLTNASISCQQKYGGFEHFPYKNVTLPRDVMADCIVNLPVCDLRNETIKNDNQKHGIVAACRNAGLPI
ncbi:hypothetical protein DFH28DRAFT_1162802 [Melampsora americana]|nr:hypothetical protein DFH28DRAFT_1162802 [Melampsora americana]